MKNSFQYCLIFFLVFPVSCSLIKAPSTPLEIKKLPEIQEVSLLSDSTFFLESTQKDQEVVSYYQDNSSYQWWKSFDDNTLNQWVTILTERNPNLKSMQYQIAQMQSQYHQVLAKQLPDIQLVLDRVTESNRASSQDFFDESAFRLRSQISWQVDLFGALANESDQAYWLYLSNQQKYNALLQSLIVELVKHRISLNFLNNSLSRELMITKLYQEKRDILNQRMLTGVMKLETSQLMAIERLIRSSLNRQEQLNNAIKLRYFEIDILLNRSLGFSKKNTQLVSFASVKWNPIQVILTDWLDNRPDIQASKYLLFRAFEEKQMRLSQLFPRLQFNINYTSQQSNIEDLFSLDDLVGQLSVGLYQSLFSGGKLLRQKKIAKLAYQREVIDFVMTLQVALKELNQLSLLDMQSLKQLNYSKDSYLEVEQFVYHQEERLKQGLLKRHEFIDNEVMRLQLKQAYESDLQSMMINRIQLYLALGGKWF